MASLPGKHRRAAVAPANGWTGGAGAPKIGRRTRRCGARRVRGLAGPGRWQAHGRPGGAIHPERRSTLDAKQALDRFLAGVERRAFVTARLATRDGEEALDIVQDAMLTMIRHYAGRPEAEWGPLFHSVLQSRINDWHRRTRVRSRWRVWLARDEDTDEDPLLNLPDGASPNPETQTANRRTLTALEAALRRLPLRQQQAFLLRVWEGLDVGETARAMCCAEGSVKTHYSRAVHSLRDMLGEHWP